MGFTLNIQKLARRISAAVVVLVLSGSAHAAVISIDPVAQDVKLHSSVTVDINISGLAAGAAPSLGAFDIDLNFDPTILSFSSATFGAGLDPVGIGTFNGATDFGGGLLNLFEVSLTPTVFLDLFQSDAFTLAQVTFEAIGAGLSDLGLSVLALSDGDGNSIGAETVGATVSVPEPSTLALLGLGLAGLGFARRK